MSHSFPLTDPNGRTFAHACGLCLRIGSQGDCMGGQRLDDEQIDHLAGSGRMMAESCCTCRRCKAPADRAVAYDWVCEPCAPLHAAEEAERDARFAAKRNAQKSAWAESLKLALDSGAASALAARMSDLSEEYYCAGWLMGCEFTLWGFVVNGPSAWGLGEFQQSEADELRDLSHKAGGWIVWNEEAGGELFVTADEWLRRYANG